MDDVPPAVGFYKLQDIEWCTVWYAHVGVRFGHENCFWKQVPLCLAHAARVM